LFKKSIASFRSIKQERKPAPIIIDYYERGFEKEFRRPDDPEKVIRINQKSPKGLPKKLYEYINVSGVTHNTRIDNVKDFIINGSKRNIMLIREPENLYDKNAVKVIGNWIDKTMNQKKEQLGYIPSEIAADLAKKYKDARISATIKALFIPVGQESPGIRIDIWGPKSKKKDLINKDIKFKFKQNEPDSNPGYFQNKHYTEYVETIKDLKRAEKYKEAEKLLLILIKAVEIESEAKDWSLAPYYYRQLAIIYRKQKLYDKEIAILERYIRKNKKWSKDRPFEFIKRIEKAKKFKTNKD
jgi:hypothetical protein